MKYFFGLHTVTLNAAELEYFTNVNENKTFIQVYRPSIRNQLQVLIPRVIKHVLISNININ